MPGICGIVGNGRSGGSSAMLAEMCARMKHYPWYRENRHVDAGHNLALARVSLGFVNTADQPIVSEDGSLLAIMEGELYDVDEQRRRLAAEGRGFRGDSHAEVLLQGYLQGGESFLQSLHGMYTAALWDKRAERLLLINDHFGMKPLYYVKLAGRLLFASEIKALLVDPEVPRKSNARGLAQWFAFGQLLGEDTLLEDIHLLPAAGWLTYDLREDKLLVRKYWQLEPAKLENDLSETEILERVDEAFQRAVERRLHGSPKLGISLSGGLDSRTILAAIDPARSPVTAVSMGMEGSIDLLSARRMAEIMKIPFHTHVLDAHFLSRFEEHLRRMVHLTDGQYVSQCIVMPTLPVYRELGIEVLLRGHAGELMHMEKAYEYSLNEDAFAIHDDASLEKWLLGHLRAGLLDSTKEPLFAGRKQGEMAQLAQDSLRQCLRDSAHITPSIHRIWHLFVSQRLRRETAQSMVKFGSVAETRMPFVDKDLIALLLAIPPLMKRGEKIQTHILRRHKPEFLEITNANTGTRVGAGPLALLFGKTRLRVLAKLGVRGYQPYERLGLWLRRELRPLVEDLLLSERSLERGLFNPDAVREVVAQHWSTRRNYTELLLVLMTFEMGQREFVDQGEGAGSSALHPAGAVL
jgi:asparagine synthase (glutamine-hydrolysing)